MRTLYVAGVPGRIAGLDGLRAISVLLVIGSHTELFDPTWPLNATTGVTIFFALSGFLITGILLEEHRRTGSIDLVRFAKRRAIRIFPPYYVALAIVALLAPIDPFAYGAALLYLTNFVGTVPANHWLSHFWTLSVEEHFYLAWPAIVLLLRGHVTRFAALVVVASAFLLLVGVSPRWTLPAVMPIALGAIVAATGFAPRGWPVLAASVVLLLVVPPVGAAGVVAWVAANPATVRPLDWRPLAYLGTISYGLYIWQGIWTGNGTFRVGPFPPSDMTLAIGLTFASAIASWHLLERPLLRRRDRP